MPRLSRFAVALLCLLAGALVWAAVRPAEPASHVRPSTKRTSDALPPSARAAVARLLGRDSPSFQAQATKNGFAFGARRTGLDARFLPDGAIVNADGFSWGLGLRAAGRRHRMVAIEPVPPTAARNQVAYRHAAGISERYDYGPLGIEQTFTLSSRPRGPPGAPLLLTIGPLPRGLRASIAPDRRSLVLTRAGQRVLRYWGLSASDAQGRSLAAGLTLTGHGLALQLDDRGARYPLRVDPFVQTAKLTAADSLGPVAIAGDTIAVGATGGNSGKGAVYVFVNSGSGWSQQAELTASDGASGDNLGGSVAISGDTIAAGAPNATVGANGGQGAVYVFVKPSAGWQNGTETAKLTASDGAANDQLGYRVGIAGNTIVAGAPQMQTAGNGAAYVFVKGTSGWSAATQAKLTSSDATSGDSFGGTVAISADAGTVAVGAPSFNSGQNLSEGKAYVFVKGAGAWSSATETTRLTASDGAANDALGSALGVAADGQTIVAGASGKQVGGVSGGGAAYVFQTTNAWTSSTQAAELTAPDGSGGDRFGLSAAIAADTIAVGAPFRGGNGFGTLYVFVKPSGGWTTTHTSSQELTASDEANGDWFAYTVAISSDASTIVAGAPHGGAGSVGPGVAYVFGAGPTQDPTSTSVSCTPPSVNVGQATTCTATVLDTTSGSPSTPTGTVTFSSDSDGSFTNPGTTCTLAPIGTTSRTAACHVDYTPNSAGSGTHTITGTYGGDSGHAGGSGHTGLTVGPATNRPTSTAAACAPSSITVGQATTCTATVTDVGSGDTSAPTGSVTFTSDSHGAFSSPGATCTLAATATAGQSSCQVTYTPTSADSGTHTLTVGYGGDSTHAASSGNAAVSVAPSAKRPSLTSISCSPSVVSTGQASTCAVTVTDAAPGTPSAPTGSVTAGSDSPGSFTNPGATCTLAPAGSAGASCQMSYTPTAVGSGMHTITATFGGDAVHSGSSEATTITVSLPGGGETPPAHAQANFGLTQSAPQVFQPVQLDGSGSVRPGSRVMAYQWTITGNHFTLRPATPCAAQTPVLQTTFARPGTYTATLQVTDSLGGVTSHTQSFQVAGASTPRASAATAGGLASRLQSTATRYATALASVPPTALCNPSGPADPNLDTTGGGGPGGGCYQQEVGESLVDAVGCFSQVDFSGVPAREKHVIAVALYNCKVCFLTDTPTSVVQQVVAAATASASTSAAGASNAVAHAAALSPNAQRAIGTLRGDFQKHTVFYVSTQPVRINGLDYTPAPGAAVVIVSPGVFDTSQPRPYVISSNATISAATDLLGSLTLRSGQLQLPIDTDSEQIAFIPFNQSVPFLPGTDLNGGVHVLLHQGSSEIVAQMALPDILRLSDDSSRRVTVTLRMTATNADGIQLSGFGVTNIDAKIYGVVAIHIGELSYDARTATFVAKDISVDTFEAAGKFDADLEIQGRRVSQFDITWTSPPPGLEVAPLVHLAQLFGHWNDTPQRTDFGGGATLTVGPAVDGCGIAGVKGDFDFQLFPLLQMTVTGDLSMACIPVGHEVATIAEDGYVNFGASVDYTLIKDVVEFSGGFSVTYYGGHFTAIADATGCAVVCAGGTGVISDKGVGLCLSLTGPFGFHWHPGFGFDWPSPEVLAGGPVATAAGILANLQLISDSCGTGPWVTVNPRARAAVAGSASVTLPRERQGAVIAVVGANGAPRVRLTGPGGQTVDTPAQGVLKTGRAIAFSNQANKTTYIALFRPAAGTWTAASLDNTPIVGLRRADILADPRVSGKVTGRGSKRLLRYRVKVPAGDDVRLFEHAPGGTQQLAQVTHGGRLRFTPSDASGSNRTILALVERNGIPVEQVTIARFRAQPPTIGRAGRIRARRAKGDVIVTWRPARGAQVQTVDVVLSDGRAYEVNTGPHARSLRISSVMRGEHLLILIKGFRAQGARHGTTASSGFQIT